MKDTHDDDDDDDLCQGQILKVSCDGDTVPYHEKEELCKTIKTPWTSERERERESELVPLRTNVGYIFSSAILFICFGLFW